MDIEPTVCNHGDCAEVWPHNHIRALNEVLEFYSHEGGGVVRHYLYCKSDDSWYEPLKRKIEAEGFFGGVHISADECEGWVLHDGHHRLLVCQERGQYWCPVEERCDVTYDYPDQWGAFDYEWVPEDDWEISGSGW